MVQWCGGHDELAMSCLRRYAHASAMVWGMDVQWLGSFQCARASGHPDVPGLRFRYDSNEGWPYPNPTGLKGVMEGFCPPHYPHMRAARGSRLQTQVRPWGSVSSGNPGPLKDSRKGDVSAAQVHSEEFRECVALQAQYMLRHVRKVPGTFPPFLSLPISRHITMYLDSTIPSISRGLI